MLYRISVVSRSGYIDSSKYLHLRMSLALEVAWEEIQNPSVIAVVFIPIPEEI